MIAFAVFIVAFHYFNFYTRQSRWKLAIETWMMIAFITWILWHTGKIDSPLLNLYLLVIIISAITLGKIITFLEFALIASAYVFLGSTLYAGATLTLADFSRFMALFAPFLLIAYITSMLAADVHYGRQMFKVLSETDEMTGLLNKRSFGSMLERTMRMAERYAHTFSIMMIDADNLKEVNDKYGHEAGDQLIITLANTVRNCVRTSDIFARYGGDEFVILLPQTESALALETGDRIRKAIANTSFDAGGNRITSTVSIGIASYPDDAIHINELLEKADSSLYVSKQSGRNQVRHYSLTRDAEKQEKEDIHCQ